MQDVSAMSLGADRQSQRETMALFRKVPGRVFRFVLVFCDIYNNSIDSCHRSVFLSVSECIHAMLAIDELPAL